MCQVPSNVLNAMRKELAMDTKTITSLNSKVGKLDELVSPQHHPRRATALGGTAAEQAAAKKSAHLQRAVNMADAKRKLMERRMDLIHGFDAWAGNSALMDAAKGQGQVKTRLRSRTTLPPTSLIPPAPCHLRTPQLLTPLHCPLQGYLAHKKHPPPLELCRALRIGLL